LEQNQTKQDKNDSSDLEHLGYAQELLRDMGGFSSFAVSFSVISILTGATQLYGYGLNHGGPLQITAGWLLVSFFTFFVALSMAELASSYPTSGALYHWSSFLGSKRLGWFTACFNTIGQFAILAGIDYGLAQFLIGILAWPSTGIFPILLYAFLLLSHAGLNHIGIKIVAWLNSFSAWYHIGVVFLLLIVLFLKGVAQPVSFLTTFKSSDGFAPPYSFLIGLLLAQWTLAGYDASAHVTEETHNPRKNAPWGIVLAVLISIIFGFIMLAAVTLSIPDLSQVMAMGDDAFTGILKLRLGVGFGTAVAGLIAGAMWLCGLGAMTSASRMVYAFARDGGLPYSKFWAHVSLRHRVPANAIWGLASLAMVLTLSVNLYTAVVSMATISLYISYGLPIFARLRGRLQNKKDEPGPWNLGRLSTPIAYVGLIWICFIIVVFVLPPNEQAGKVMGICFILLCLIWFFVARHRFKGPKFHIDDK